MDEEFHLFEFRHLLGKVERNRPGVEEQYYRENACTEFYAFMAVLAWPVRLVGRGWRFLRAEKKSGAVNASGQVYEHCFD